MGLKVVLSMWLQVADTVHCDLEQEHMTHPVTKGYAHLLTHLLSRFYNLNLPWGGLTVSQIQPTVYIPIIQAKVTKKHSSVIKNMLSLNVF